MPGSVCSCATVAPFKFTGALGVACAFVDERAPLVRGALPALVAGAFVAEAPAGVPALCLPASAGSAALLPLLAAGLAFGSFCLGAASAAARGFDEAE